MGVPIYPSCHGYTLITLFWRMRTEERAKTTDPTLAYIPFQDGNDKDYQQSGETELEIMNSRSSSRVRLDRVLSQRTQGKIAIEFKKMARLMERQTEKKQKQIDSYLDQKCSFWNSMESFVIDSSSNLQHDSFYDEEDDEEPTRRVIRCHSTLIQQHRLQQNAITTNGCMHALLNSPRLYNSNHPSSSPGLLTRARLRGSSLPLREERAISLQAGFTQVKCRVPPAKAAGKGKHISFGSLSAIIDRKENTSPRQAVSHSGSNETINRNDICASSETAHNYAESAAAHGSSPTDDTVPAESSISRNTLIQPYDCGTAVFPRNLQAKLDLPDRAIARSTTHADFEENLRSLWNCFFPSTSAILFFNGTKEIKRH
jgi:hypothetical protein